MGRAVRRARQPQQHRGGLRRDHGRQLARGLHPGRWRDREVADRIARHRWPAGEAVHRPKLPLHALRALMDATTVPSVLDRVAGWLLGIGLVAIGGWVWKLADRMARGDAQIE